MGEAFIGGRHLYTKYVAQQFVVQTVCVFFYDYLVALKLLFVFKVGERVTVVLVLCSTVVCRTISSFALAATWC